MGSDYEEYCSIWADNTTSLEEELENCVTFSLVFHVSFIHLPQDFTEDEVFDINNLTESFIDTQTFSVPRDRLLNNNTSQETLEEILSSMHVPSRQFFKEKILRFARAMADDKTYQGYKVLCMHVRICAVIIVDDDDEEEEEDEEEEVPMESTMAMVGTSKEAIERLEMVKVNDRDRLRGPCAICLQEFLLGLHVSRLPNCCHLFHGDCILNWLKESKFCPLCRVDIS